VLEERTAIVLQIVPQHCEQLWKADLSGAEIGERSAEGTHEAAIDPSTDNKWTMQVKDVEAYARSMRSQATARAL
jgi:hypothetical protein